MDWRTCTMDWGHGLNFMYTFFCWLLWTYFGAHLHNLHSSASVYTCRWYHWLLQMWISPKWWGNIHCTNRFFFYTLSSRYRWKKAGFTTTDWKLRCRRVSCHDLQLSQRKLCIHSERCVICPNCQRCVRLCRQLGYSGRPARQFSQVPHLTFLLCI